MNIILFYWLNENSSFTDKFFLHEFHGITTIQIHKVHRFDTKILIKRN